MDFSQLIDIFLHLDKHLAAVVETYGPLVYGLLFLIVFVETGVVVMPFLPGDSLLFVAGTLAGIGALDLPLLLIVLFAAAVIGDNTNYWIGRKIGPKVFHGEPLNEKVVSYGPFVMNTQTQIMEAMRDYQMGKMGVLIEQ